MAVALTELTQQCVEAGGKPDATDAVKAVDLTGDQTPDFVLYAGWIVCEGFASLYGDRTKSLTVFAATSSGAATEAFVGWVYDVHVESSGDTAKLWLTTDAGNCGRERAEVFADETFCDRAIDWNAPAKRFEYAPLDTVRIIQ